MSKFTSNAITWFEIPTTDLERATKFYETVLDVQLIPYGEDSKVFPRGEESVSGCLTHRAASKPSTDGALVFLNADGKLDVSVKRAEGLGAKVTVPRTEIPGGFGYFACLIDSEGNQVGLHSTRF
ncbi:VOC family protein [Terriglobus sp. RCC_193]|uniref:VOC family protein n=1 Tax=Terriglobus sp. RCC_193 TaxID=3239218 RepID=UPI0035268305